LQETNQAPGTDSTSIFVADRLSIIVATTLLAAAAISWAATYDLAPLMGASSGMAGMGVDAIASSLSLTSVVIFEFVWVVGMAAMMFPAMLP
jgi:hypothetical protein